MELEVQSFLRAGRTLADLEAAYAIRSRVSGTLGVVSLNYNQIASPMGEMLCQQCRALILEVDTWNVVSRSFFKFFNAGETHAHSLDWALARVEEKVDGSLICFYFHRDAWHVATKGTPDASGAVGDSALSFRQLVEQTLTAMGCPFAEFTTLLDPKIFYSFELTAPENRIIVPYAAPQLTWLGAWDSGTLAELELADLPALPMPRVRTFALQTLADVQAALLHFAPLEGEGFVVRDGAFRRLKLKSPAYLRIDRVLCGLTTPPRKIELVLSDGFDDVLPLLPEAIQTELQEIIGRLAAFRLDVLTVFETLRTHSDRKAFASAALAHSFAPLLFWLHDGVSLDNAIRRSRPEKLAKWLTLE